MPKLLIAATLILGLVTSASAECAWILWLEAQEGWDATTRDSVSWDRLGVYVKQEACLTEARSRIESMGQVAGRMNAENGKATWEDRGGLFHFWQYQCWPDTVDPRDQRGSAAPLRLGRWLGWVRSWFR
jgi:hypothetical protein